ncbi:MAG: ATP-grasp domain-containing protein [Pseudomonadota bacterium]|nr:ATP-grasp domain-containing protein [Pseudomonadota bacterium]
MIKILIYEYITGGGLINEDLSSSLLNEAKLMMSTLHKDLKRSNQITFKFFLDERIEGFPRTSTILVKKNNLNNPYNVNLLKNFDYIFPILPESNLILYNYVKFLEEKKIKKIISDKKTILHLSNKLYFYKLFSKHQLNIVPTYNINETKEIKKLRKVIIKDKYGVGCSYVKFYKNSKEIDFLKYNSNYVVQPYIKGKSYSISAFFTHNDLYLLSINKQEVCLSNNNFLKLKRILVNIKDINELQIYCILNDIRDILPNLYGFIGIDIIVEKEKIHIVEINPRLTTSYVGLYETTNINLFDIINGKNIKKRIISGKKYNIRVNE